MGKPRLSPGKQQKSKKKIFGFDIETHGQKNNFLCASIIGDDYEFFTTNKQKLIDEFQNSRFVGSIVAATNLSFDFFGTFDKTEELMCFQTLFRGSSLLYAKSWFDDKKKFFMKMKGMKSKGTICFLDTLNYAKMSVEQMGKILGIEKLDMQERIGKIPRNKKEWVEMKSYNIRDSTISRNFMLFLYKGFEELGATPKLTIASTAMSLFRNKYLKQSYFVQDQEDILDVMKGYYGGRTETFKRGVIRGSNYYDINSMYPHCMTKPLPDPNTQRVTRKDTSHYIMKYEGISKVDITCPKDLKIPYLPYRWQGKLVFPTGEFTGWYTHLELRKALGLGYHIKKVHKSHYYKSTCLPLKHYAKDLYETRLKFKKEKSPMQIVYKLLLNSLYGKFGQRFLDRETYTPASEFTIEQIHEMKDIEIINGFVRHKKDSKPAHFCIPIWASYITSYARDMLYDYLIGCDPWYCDTDSIITDITLPTGDGLGEMKLEMSIKEGVIIKPKMYALIDDQNNKIVKIKGVKKKVLVGNKEVSLDYNVFMALEQDNKVEYKKFIKFKEAMRRGLTVNEIIPFAKVLDLEDSKRMWCMSFDWHECERSRPLVMIEGMESEHRKKLVRKAREQMERQVEKDMKSFINSDLFDKESVGCDISPIEFIENEKFFDTME